MSGLSNPEPNTGADTHEGDLVLARALAYVSAGISVLPIKRGGRKQPESKLLPDYYDEAEKITKRGWKPFQGRLPTESELRSWYAGKSAPPGIAAICGNASNHLEMMDFDNKAEVVFGQWCAQVELIRPGLTARLTVIRSPRPGYHVWYRCPAVTIPGNLELASDPAKADPKTRTLIETRGEGGYALVPGCPPECHEARKPYELFSGPPLQEVAVVTKDERDELHAAARMFNIMPMGDEPDGPDDGPDDVPPGLRNPGASSGPSGDLRPGDDFDRRGDWSFLLSHGWHIDRTSGDVTHWTRPDKPDGTSATTGKCRGKDGVDLLKVFTSSTTFPLGWSGGRFRAYALLNHGGDLSKAASELRGRGFGGQGGQGPRAGQRKKQPAEDAATADPAAPQLPHWRLDLDGRILGDGFDTDMPDIRKPGGIQVFSMSSLKTVMNTTFPPPRWVVPGLLSEGLNILAGAPKMGKSMLALNLALTVAGRGKALGDRDVTSGDVLYLSLEDQMRRVKERAVKMLKGLMGVQADTAADFLTVVTEWQRQDRGGLKMLELWIEDKKRRDCTPVLLIIDVWNRYAPSSKGTASAYTQDADAMALLKTLADHHDITVLVLHHTRKSPPGSKPEDFVNEVSGTLGLAGTADGILGLVRARGSNEATLYCTGRDHEEGELVVEFEPATFTWKSLGTAAEHMTGKVQTAIVEFLKKRGTYGESAPGIAKEIGQNGESVRRALNRMLEVRAVTKKGNLWLWPGESNVF